MDSDGTQLYRLTGLVLDTGTQVDDVENHYGINYPGSSLNSDRDYMLWARGSTPAGRSRGGR